MEPTEVNQYPVNQGNTIPEIQNEEDFDGKMPPTGNKKLKLLAIMFIGFIILTIIPLSFFLYTKVQKSSLLAESQTKALDAYKKGDIVGLQKELLNSYKIAPKDPKTQAALIKAIATEGNLTGREQEAFNKAAPYVADALATNGNNAEVLASVGYVNEIAGKYNEALSFYEKALNIDDKNAEGWFHKGHVLEFLGKKEDSMAAYKKAYTLDPNNALVLTGEARALLAESKTDDAFNIYKKVGLMENAQLDIRADALTNASFIRRSQILYMQEAIDLSEKAIKLAPNYSPALATHGFNLGINGRFTEGTEFIKKSLVANPRISQNYYYLGLLYRSVKDYGNALKYQEEGFARIDSDNTILDTEIKQKTKGNMAYDLAKTYSLSDTNTDKIIELLEAALQLNPNLKSTLKSNAAIGKPFTESLSNPRFQALIQ